MATSPTGSEISPMLMPAEWEKQQAMWLAWPHQKRDWPGKFEPILWVYADIVRHLSRVVRVQLVVKDAKAKEAAQRCLEMAGVDLDQVSFHLIPTNRAWLRDSAPIFVRDGTTQAMIDWRFTGWAKYPNHTLDNALPEAINHTLKLERVRPIHKGRNVVLEGGSIDVNGKGCLLTTEECLLSDRVQVRNPGFTREDYESLFEHYLGATHTIWLGHGITGDDTHGHVDDLARFVNAGTIVTVVEKDKHDANYAPLNDNLKRLKRACDAKGKLFDVVPLPMPKPIFFDGVRLPASYANFLICNHLVLVPTFNDANDRVALSVLAELMPKHEIIGIHATDLVWGFGTLHCMSQQQPA